jgi:hypothetical protein
MAKEGVRSFFKGAGANILRGVAGAGVLSIYDQGQLKYFLSAAHNLTLASTTPPLRQGLQGRFRLDKLQESEDDTEEWMGGRLGLASFLVVVTGRRLQLATERESKS